MLYGLVCSLTGTVHADTVSQHTGLSKILTPPLPQLGAALMPVTVTIPAGCFLMGSPDTEQERVANEALHRVCVKSFKLSKTEVSVAEFRQFINATQFVTDAEHNTEESGCWSYDHTVANHWDWWAWASWQLPIKDVSTRPAHPVGCVSFHDVQAYIAWLNTQSEQQYRLPTEAEWEYAARAATATARYWGNNAALACRYANVADEKQLKTLGWAQLHSCTDGYFFNAPVGSLLANAWGLHDMLGNVWEWTCSAYSENYNGKEAECVSVKPAFADLIVLRGGGWNADPQRVRAAYRNWSTAWARQANLGFRLVRTR